MLCLTFCYLRAGAHIREKVHFVELCVFVLSAIDAFKLSASRQVTTHPVTGGVVFTFCLSNVQL